MSRDFRLWARDHDLHRRELIEDFERAELRPRFNTPGTWLVEGVPADRPAAQVLREPTAGIEVLLNGSSFLSGRIDSHNREFDAASDTLSVGGETDSIALWERVVHPQPGTASPPYSATAYDAHTGQASTVMIQYVDEQIGPGALAPRRLAHLVLAADPAIGATVHEQARWSPLLGDLLTRIARNGGRLGFDIRPPTPQTSPPTLEFVVYQPRELVGTVRFSREFGNLAGFHLQRTGPRSNYEYVGGGNQGVNRKIVEVDDVVSIVRWGSRREAFADARDTTDDAVLIERGQKQLEDGAEKSSLTATVIDSDQATFGVDFGLGDRVSVFIDGVEYADVVGEVIVKLEPRKAPTVTPVIGTPVTLDALRREQQSLAARLRHLEGSQ